MATPVFLFFVCAYFCWPDRKALRRDIPGLLPFFISLALYILFRIPALHGTAEGAYRTHPNFHELFKNGVKYPLWTVRLFTKNKNTLEFFDVPTLLLRTIASHSFAILGFQSPSTLSAHFRALAILAAWDPRS